MLFESEKVKAFCLFIEFGDVGKKIFSSHLICYSIEFRYSFKNRVYFGHFSSSSFNFCIYQCNLAATIGLSTALGNECRSFDSVF